MSKSKRNRNKQRPPTAGSFTDGPDPRRADGQFKPGPDERRQPGGKPAVLREFTEKLREVPVETLVADLRDMMASKHGPTRIAAWKEWMRWGFGSPPKPASDTEVPADDTALLAALEKQLKQRALEGDAEAQLLLLRALDPARYGRDPEAPKPAGSGAPSLRIVPVGTARPDHKPEADDVA